MGASAGGPQPRGNDAARTAAMGANRVLAGHLTRLLCRSVNPFTCVTRDRTKHRADCALHGRVGLGSDLAERLQVPLKQLRDWLKRAIADGKAMKKKKKGRVVYGAATGDVDGSLFD